MLSLDLKYMQQKLNFTNYANQNWNAAAVLITDGEYTFFIKRSELVKSFKGHVAFVGGNRLSTELTPLETIEREFMEETALGSDFLLALGLLPVVSTGERVEIAPVVMWSSRPILEWFANATSNGEWDFCLAVKNDFLFNAKHWSRAGLYYPHKPVRDVLFCPLAPAVYKANIIHKEGLVLWGATARMIRNLVEVLELSLEN
jgi:8-oxo-dGTP pyrophosphatase MutT (NUDIX family)